MSYPPYDPSQTYPNSQPGQSNQPYPDPIPGQPSQTYPDPQQGPASQTYPNLQPGQVSQPYLTPPPVQSYGTATPQYGVPPQQYPYVQPVAVIAPPSNGLAVASMVLGIISLVTIWFGIGILSAILGVIFGHVSMGQIKNSHGTQGGNGMAVAGLVMSYIVLVPTILCLGLVLIGAASVPFLPHS
jgi:Domain of unknown function (DUF4190)